MRDEVYKLFLALFWWVRRAPEADEIWEPRWMSPWNRGKYIILEVREDWVRFAHTSTTCVEYTAHLSDFLGNYRRIL